MRLSQFAVLMAGLLGAGTARAEGLEMGSADALYRRCQSTLSGSVTPDMYQRGLDTGICGATVWTTWGVLKRARPMWDVIDHLPQLPKLPKDASEQQRQRLVAESLRRIMLITDLSDIGPPACIPENANLHTMIMIVVKYGQDHPDKLTKQAYDFVGEALSESFKCPGAPANDRQ